MDKIKAFFTNTITKVVAWVCLILSAAALIIGGVTTETISSGIVLTAGIISAVAALVAFISSQIKK